MKIENKMISTRQFLFLVFIIGMVMKMFMLPSSLLKVSGRDSAIVMLIYFFIESVNVFIIAFIIKKHPDKTFFEVMTDCFGKVLSRIIVGATVLAVVLKFLLSLSEIKSCFATSMY